MAYVKVNMGYSPTVLYLVEKAVGPGCPNVRDDVLLVQFFLRALSGNTPRGGGSMHHLTHERFPDFKLAGPPLPINGQCGPQTIAYIKNFQEQFKTRGNPSTVATSDGVVSPVLKGSRGTIIDLNMEYVDETSAAEHANLHRDPLFPRELVGEFFFSM